MRREIEFQKISKTLLLFFALLMSVLLFILFFPKDTRNIFCSSFMNVPSAENHTVSKTDVDDTAIGQKEFVEIPGSFYADTFQGVAIDGTYIYTTTSSDIHKYSKSGILQATRKGAVDDGSGGTQINGCFVANSKLYVSATNWWDEPKQSWVREYALSDLAYLGKEHIMSAYWIEGGSYHDGYFWFVYDPEMIMEKWNSNWELVETYNLEAEMREGFRYQGNEWLGDYVYCNIHAGPNPKKVDKYYYDGEKFTLIERINRPADCSQDLAYDRKDNVWYFVRRVDITGNEVVFTKIQQ